MSIAGVDLRRVPASPVANAPAESAVASSPADVVAQKSAAVPPLPAATATLDVADDVDAMLPHASSCCGCDLLFCYVYALVALVARRAQEDAALPMPARRMLQADELWPLDTELAAVSATAAVEAAWRAEVAEHKDDPSVLNAVVWRMHGGAAGVPRLAALYLGKIFGSLGQPVFFWCILELYFKSGYSQGAGYGFVAALVVSAILASILEHQGLYQSGRLKVATTIGLRGLIYQKALRLREFQMPQQDAKASSTSAGAGGAAGASSLGLSQWVSVVAADAPAVAEYLNVICPMWIGIFETAACIALMAVIVDYAVFAGFIVVLVLVFVSNSLASQIGTQAKAIGAAGGQRTQLLGQLLGIIRAVKFYAWESEFVSALTSKRRAEEEQLHGFHKIKTVSFVVAVIAPLFLGVAVMLIYSAYSFITLSVAFPALVLLGILRNVLWNMPLYLSAYLDAGVAAKRIRAFLDAPEVDAPAADATEVATAAVAAASASSTATLEQIRLDTRMATDYRAVSVDRALPLGTIRLQNAHFAWGGGGDASGFALTDLTLECRSGTLTAIVGSVGSGKTSLVLAVLGEMAAASPASYCKLNGRVAYVPQSAFILNATCKENILFGAPLDRERYDACVTAAQLHADFKELVNGQDTMIGDKGMTISGGQKQRISIARALYSQSDIVVLDDPLSAVDAHVSNKLFYDAICGPLMANRTRLFVTNQTQYLPHCDQAVLLRDGRMAACGTPAAVTAAMQDDPSAVVQSQRAALDDEDVNEEGEDGDGDEGARGGDMNAAKAASTRAEAVSAASSSAVAAAQAASVVVAVAASSAAAAAATVKPTTNAYDVCDLFTFILRGAGALLCILLLNLVIFVTMMGHQFSLSIYALHVFPEFGYGNFAAAFTASFAVVGLLAFVRSAAVAHLTAACFNDLHDRLLQRVFYSPMAFFETHTSGMILEWFGGNIGFLDRAAASLMDLAFATLFLFGLFMLALIVLYPWLLIAAAPVVACVAWLIVVFRPVNFQSTQLKLRTETPVASHFSQSLAGLVSIRAYAAQQVFTDDWRRKLNASGRAELGFVACGQWVTNFADLAGIILIIGAGVLAVVARDTSVAGVFGSSGGTGSTNGVLTFTAARAALSLFFGTWVCAMASRVINIQVSVGDIFSVTTKLRNLLALPIERESDVRPPPMWPSAGAVDIENLVMRYRPELPPVLRSVSCSIRAGEKIGIVGRTGAGKSSFVTALFRLAEADAGSRVAIDGVAIDALNLQALRARLSIITQDPVCVQGSVRYNVDPLRACGDDDTPIWRALEIAQLAAFVRSCAAGLDHVIDSTGSNISMGQKQQLSMARALLHRPKLIVMDEASSSIDNDTDALIQRAMEQECRDSTCLIIAHRLNTVMSCDRIMVLERGTIAEFDSPHNILQNADSLLSGLVRATGRKKAATLRETARRKHEQRLVAAAPV